MIAYPENTHDHSCKLDLPVLVEAEKHLRPQKPSALLCGRTRQEPFSPLSDFFERLRFSGSKMAVAVGKSVRCKM